MSETMISVKIDRPGGKPVIQSVPVPEPGPGEVLVKMAASPINPSDLAAMKGGYLANSWPFTPGVEGSGTVVKAGRGVIPALRAGKRVACSPNPGEDGTWAQFMKTSALRTVPLPNSLGMEQGAMMLINPMTALVFLHLARKGRHRAMVNNAAASSLGKMLVRLCQANSIPLISIVRREAQVEELLEMGAPYVLNSSRDSFEQELQELALRLDANLFLDAVSGSETGRLLRCAPDGSELVTYARLSGEPVKADPADLILHGKSIRGFHLRNWLDTQSMAAKLRLSARVRKQIMGTLAQEIRATYALEQAEEAIERYREAMSGGKILLVNH
jgi:NADPH2:quinone reductase